MNNIYEVVYEEQSRASGKKIQKAGYVVAPSISAALKEIPCRIEPEDIISVNKFDGKLLE